ncbi:MAG: DNA polymerase III subunit gamma/tau [Candidatus Saccharibacteria bacterium]|nr:DNA polymerase III subunit gamma/tau [Candidatus Saccharibacteria bacterium]
MSLVLYRKYRPKNLDEIVAQKGIVTVLKAALKRQSLGHAILLTGPRGIGKTSLARILAHELNQIDYSLDQTPIDIIEIDAASNGRIDEVRDLREKIKLMPLELKYKIYIIDEVHMLTKEAFNGLLKTLEEPPQHVIFILATTEMHKVPATIISRCQHFNLRLISDQEISEHLSQIAKKEKIDITDSAVASLAQVARGSLRDALSLLDQLATLNKTIDQDLIEHILGLPPQDLTLELLKTIKNDDFQKVIECYQKLMAQGVDAVLLAHQLAYHLRLELQKLDNKQAIGRILLLLEDLLLIFQAHQPQTSLEIILLKHTQSGIKMKS